MKAFFDRTAPFYITDKPGFFANPVEVPADVVKNVKDFADLLTAMEALIQSNAAAEKVAQEEADFMVEEIQKIFKKRKL